MNDTSHVSEAALKVELKRVESYLRSQYGFHSDIDELVGHVFLRIATYLPKYDPGLAPLRPWIVANSRWGAYDFFRVNMDAGKIGDSFEQWTHYSPKIRGVPLSYLCDNASALATLIGGRESCEIARLDAKRIVDRLLKALTPKQIRVIQGYYLNGNNLREIAHDMKISWQGVDLIRKRALLRLRQRAATLERRPL